MHKNLLNNTFFKVITYNSIVVFGRLITSFIVSKVSAIYLGPSGYAIVGNLKSILQGILGVTSTGFQSGVIRYVTENKTNKEELKIVVSSITFLSILISGIIGILIFFFSEQLSIYILKDVSFTDVFKWFALLLPFVSLSFLTVYIVNGLQRYKLYTVVVSLSNFLNALISFILIYYFDLKGALFASIIVPAFSFLFGFAFKEIRNIYSGVIKCYKQLSIAFVKSISAYLFMAVYSSLLISFSYLFIRNELIDGLSAYSAGLWEAMNKISSFYMIFFSSLFTLYLLPQLTLNKTVTGYYGIMKNYFKYLIPFMIAVFLGLYIFRIIVIKVFLTDEFKSIEQYFILQFIGDFIKIVAFSLAYQFHAKKMVSSYFISDAILYGTFYFFSTYFIEQFNLQGVFYAYIVSTLLYLSSVSYFVYFKRSNYLNSEI
ncbi:O-antigen translocase [Seonamhaeicola maritimus]|uniref:O-antigen translocase n=1 Tax=Seonamhaeicola maritimus TaxID=2591822 RepID=A0A5C7GD59_9FLAO|nr:O-antigen translocase [Seonamhaeicola maritimus]TXG34559.1 O-antigen translocase [Seonamhaeicola maritimus]